jgi:hypothetical protein
MALWFERRGGACAFSLALAVAIGATAVIAPASSADITVILDQAKLVKLPDRVATVVIGNPLIADAAVQTGGQVVLTGKGYGRTNIIALDRGGAVLLEKIVEVQGPRTNVVTVYRGVTRETYSCTPSCDPRITPGDAAEFFGVTIGQTVTRSNTASGVVQPPK